MAQIIKLRRGTLAELNGVTLNNGEIGVVTSSVASIGDSVLKTGLVVGNTDGTNRLSIARIITGNATPDLSGVTGGSAFNDMLYHETDAKALKVLNTGGNTTLDLSANISVSEIAGNVSASATSTGSFGYLNVDGDATIGGNLTFGDADTDYVSFAADISSSLIPDVSDSYNLGSTGQRWNNLWMSGSLTANGGNHSITSDDTIDIDADGALTIDGGSIAIGTDANVAVDFNSSTFDLDSSGAITVDGLSTLSVDVDGATNINTSAGNITVDSEAGSLVLDGHTGVDIDASDSGKVAIDGAGGIDIGVNADVAIDVDASTFDLDASGAVTIDGATGSHFKAAGTLALSGSAVTIAGGGGSEIDITTTGGAIDVNSDTLDVDTTSTVAIDAVGVSIDSSAASNLTTSAGALTLTSAAAATWSTSAGALVIDGAGGLTLDSDGTDAVNLGTEAVAKTITIGNAASTKVDINALALDFDSAAATDILAASTLSAKGATGASFGDDTGTWEFDGSGAVSETGMTTISMTPSSTFDIDAGGAVTIDGTAITIGADDSGVAISIGHSTSETTINDNLTVTGNFTANGVTTFVSSSQLDIGDNIIHVNAVSPVRYGGIHVRDIISTANTGSLVWDGTNDYWVAGQSGSEYRVPLQDTTTDLTDNKIVIAQGNGRIESSANITDDGSTVDFNDVDLTSLDKLEGVDANTYVDIGGSGLIVTKGTIQPSAHGGNDLGATATRYANLWLSANADVDGYLTVAGAITASGHISASGTVSASKFIVGTDAGGAGIRVGASAENEIDSDGTVIVDGATGITLQEGGTAVMAIDTNRDVLFSQTGGSSGDADVEIDGYLQVDGTAEFNGTVDIDGTVDVDNDTFSVDSSGAISLDAGATSNLTTSAGDIDINAAANLDLDGATVDIDSAGALSLQGGAASDLTTGAGAITVDGKVGISLKEDGTDVIAIDTNRDVLFSQTGGSTSDPDVEIDGYLRVDGTAEFDGAVDMDSTLDVEGLADFQARVDAQASLQVTGSLYVSAGGSVEATGSAGNGSFVAFKNESNDQFGYLTSSITTTETSGIVGYSTNGTLTVSSVVDGGTF